MIPPAALCCNSGVPVLLLLLALVRPAEAAAPRVDPRIFAARRRASARRCSSSCASRPTCRAPPRSAIGPSAAATCTRRCARTPPRRRRRCSSACAHPASRSAATSSSTWSRSRPTPPLAEALAARADVVRRGGQSRDAPAGGRIRPRGPRAAPPRRRHRRAQPRPDPRSRALGARRRRARGSSSASADTGFEWEHAALQRPLPRLGRRERLPRLQLARRHPRRPRRQPVRVGRDRAVRRRRPRHGDLRPRWSATTAASNRIGVAPGRAADRVPQHGRGQRHAGPLHRVLRVVPRADRCGGRESAAGPRRRRHQQLLGLSRERGLHEPGHPEGVVENVRAAGIAVVVAAGNSGGGSGTVLPACSTISDVPSFYDAATTVGAVDATDAIAGFSSIGPVLADGSNRLKPDLVAPGVSLRIVRARRRLRRRASPARRPRRRTWRARWPCCGRRCPELAGDVDRTEEALERGAVALTVDLTCGAFAGARRPQRRLRVGPPRRGGGVPPAPAAAIRARPVRPAAPDPARPRAPLRPAGSE